ncbi:MAG: hypothetical protein CBE14_001915 [Rickettsiales bacterium TMED254]|nr:MAG: hypothetical protein CBE14_001915 [Rickettsiales bacterium TMED254]
MKFATEQVEDGAEPVAVAAVLMAHALSLYYNYLDEESYEMILEAIYQKRHEVGNISQIPKTLH